jgi:hypothetical protein
MPVCSKLMAGSRSVSVELLDPFLGAQQLTLQPLDRQPSTALGVLQLRPQGVQLAVEVGLLQLRGQRKTLERGAGQDDCVPVAGGDPGHEQPAPVAGEVLGAGGEDPGLRVGLHPLAGELFQHVVGHHNRWLLP